jgi:hypothetical protein
MGKKVQDQEGEARNKQPLLWISQVASMKSFALSSRKMGGRIKLMMKKFAT